MVVLIDRGDAIIICDADAIVDGTVDDATERERDGEAAG